MTEVPATPSHRQEQGREAFRLFGYYAHNPYAPRINDICAYENWLEGFLQEQWAAEFKVYVAEIEKLGGAGGDWINAFNDGLTPAEAWRASVQSGDH